MEQGWRGAYPLPTLSHPRPTISQPSPTLSHPLPTLSQPSPNEGVRRVRSTGGGGGSGAVNFVWKISSFKLAAKFPTQNPGASTEFPAANFTTADLTWHAILPPV